MSSFKNKPNKLKYLSNIKTLDEIHREHMNIFTNNKKSLPQIKKNLSMKIKEYDSINNNKNNFTIEHIRQKADLKTQIELLKDEIKKIEQDDDIKEYFSKTGDILLDYYKITSGSFYNMNGDGDRDRDELSQEQEQEQEPSQELNQEQEHEPDHSNSHNHGSANSSKHNPILETKTKPSSNPNPNPNPNPDQNQNSLKILNKLSQSQRKIKKPVKKRKYIEEPVKNKNIFNFFPGLEHVVQKPVNEFNNNEVINRATLQDKYLMLVNSNYMTEHVNKFNIKWCNSCDIEKLLIQSEGYYVCSNCGETENTIIDTEVPNKDINNDKQKYPYKKLNHLKEKLKKFKAKETIDIPEKIFDAIETELKKKRIKPHDAKPHTIRKILRKYKFTDYYEHLQQIYCKITGNQPIVISKEIEEEIYSMFNKMQDSYVKHMPANRSNFLNYSYVLNKIFKILNMEQHSKYFSLLKSKDKLREQDMIWNKICKDMKWKYFASNTRTQF